MADDLSAPPVHTEDVRDELERLRLLHAISQDFSSSLDFDELLPKVFDSVLSAVGAQGGSIWIAEGGGDVLRCRLALGSASQKLVGTEMPVGTGFVGDVARKQRTTIVQDAMQDARVQQRIDRSSTMVTTTVMATPMIAKGVTVGAIQVANKVTGGEASPRPRRAARDQPGDHRDAGPRPGTAVGGEPRLARLQLRPGGGRAARQSRVRDPGDRRARPGGCQERADPASRGAGRVDPGAR